MASHPQILSCRAVCLPCSVYPTRIQFGLVQPSLHWPCRGHTGQKPGLRLRPCLPLPRPLVPAESPPPPVAAHLGSEAPYPRLTLLPRRLPGARLLWSASRVHTAGAGHRSPRVLWGPRNLFSAPQIGFWWPLAPVPPAISGPCGLLLAVTPAACPRPCRVNVQVCECGREGAAGSCSAPKRSSARRLGVQLPREHLASCLGEPLPGLLLGLRHGPGPTDRLADNQPTMQCGFPGVDVTFPFELIMEMKFPFLLGMLIDPTGTEAGDSWVRVSDQGILRPRLLPMPLLPCLDSVPLGTSRLQPLSSQPARPAPRGHRCGQDSQHQPVPDPVRPRAPEGRPPGRTRAAPPAGPAQAALWVVPVGPSWAPTPDSTPRLLAAVRASPSSPAWADAPLVRC